MRTPRVIATRCRYCALPIEEGKLDEPWCLTLDNRPVHVGCLNESTKEREFKENAERVNRPA